MARKNRTTPDKRIWTAYLIIGVLLMAGVVFFSGWRAMRTAEERFCQTLEFVKSQSTSFEKYNDTVVAKALRRTAVAVHQLAENPALDLSDPQCLNKQAEKLWLTGISVLGPDGTLQCESTTNGIGYARFGEQLKNDAVLDGFSYPRKTYVKRVLLEDGSAVDVAAHRAESTELLLLAYRYTPAEFVEETALSIQSVLDGYPAETSGTLFIVQNNQVIASNRPELIGQDAADSSLVQGIRKAGTAETLIHTHDWNGSGCYFGMYCHGRSFDLYAYTDEKSVFRESLPSILMALVGYILLVMILWVLRRRSVQEMEQQKKEMKEFLDDLTTRDQRMMFAVITMVITADSKEQLENDTEALLTTARKHLCQFATLRFQQVDGLNTVMPFGTRKIDAFRTLTTESLSVFIPFRVQDIFHENGIYYGQNVISKNMIIADRKQLLNGNSFILGVSGGGKSFAAKGEIINQVLSSDADIIIIDPEREYSQLVNAMGGEVINISATSDNHINAMDMNKDYGDGANPVILKSEFIMSLCEQLIGGTNLGAKQKSIIDRCTASVYRSYQQNDYQGHIPTLQDFRAELLQQDEPEAKELALAIELFTHGSLNTFAKQTNVDTNNRLICYDILDLGKQLMPIGMLVVLDSILNRITQNRAKGKNTFIFIDEIYLLFQHEYSANFLFTLWKRVRKYGAYASGITQNVDDLLQSHTARTMLANSEFIIMLNQASTDRLELAKLLNISDLQMSYITNVEAGHGLIKVGSSLVPFANKFPKNTKLYKLMTTKPGEA